MTITRAICVAAMAMLVTSAAPARAYQCNVPAIVDPVKKTVCATPQLVSLDKREVSSRRSVNAVLPVSARTRLEANRTSFVRTRQTCGADPLCLEATYKAQIRLYDRLRACAPAKSPATCAGRVIEQHRQELHQSL